MRIPLSGVCRLLCVCSLGWIALPVAAELYQCQLADGSALYSDTACLNGHSEPLSLHENTALDSSAERNNIAQYNSPEARRRRAAKKPMPQVLLIRDSATAERNARITKETRKPKKKAGKKARKKAKPKSKPKNGKADKKTAAQKTD